MSPYQHQPPSMPSALVSKQLKPIIETYQSCTCDAAAMSTHVRNDGCPTQVSPMIIQNAYYKLLYLYSLPELVHGA